MAAIFEFKIIDKKRQNDARHKNSNNFLTISI